MNRSEDKREGRSEMVRARAMILDWLPALIAVVLLGVIQELELFGSGDTWKLFWSLINLAPALWIVRAVVRALQRADEYQRRQLEAMAIGFGMLWMAIFTVGLVSRRRPGLAS